MAQEQLKDLPGNQTDHRQNFDETESTIHILPLVLQALEMKAQYHTPLSFSLENPPNPRFLFQFWMRG